MSCVCVDSGINKFPSSLGCIVKDGYSASIPRKKRYLGGGSMIIDNPIVNATVFIENDLDMNIFTYWWITELDYGYNEFAIETKFFGINRVWTVKALNDVTEKFNTTVDIIREIELKLELVESDFDVIVETGASDIICDICGG